MKKIVFLSLCFVATFQHSFAQTMRPLTGNGITQKSVSNIAAFENLEVLWVSGNITVEFGAAQSDVTIESDANIFQLLKVVTNIAGTLRLEIPNNDQNRLWIEDYKTKIYIRTTAQARQIIYKANANAIIRNINSTQLSVIKSGNGNLKMEGKAASLVIKQDDNGNLDAAQLIVDQANVAMVGNGNVDVNAEILKRRLVRGNGGVKNVADGIRNDQPTVAKRIHITFYNPENEQRKYSVSGINESGRKFSYGLSLKSMEKQTEYLPIGTKVRRNGKIVATLTTADDKQLVRL